MKHNSHIYVAAKAMGMAATAVDNLVDEKGEYLTGSAKSAARTDANEMERLLHYYKERITEATWAPDDVLHDNHPFHVFKLFAEDEFPNHGMGQLAKFKDPESDRTYWKFSGGLPYRVDHMAQEIANMEKLRAYNDQYTLKQILYLYLMISHYVADAHVPNHCDLRDDPPKDDNSGQPEGSYMEESAHRDLEELWDKAVTPVALAEDIAFPGWDTRTDEPTPLSPRVTFDMTSVEKGGEIKVHVIPQNKLMDFMINMCIKSKNRARDLFPVADPRTRNDDLLPQLTRTVFADTIGDLLSVWRYIWVRSRMR